MIFTTHGLALKGILVAGLLVSQMALALYVSLRHQRGVMDVKAWFDACIEERIAIGRVVGLTVVVLGEAVAAMIGWDTIEDPDKDPAEGVFEEACIFSEIPIADLSYSCLHKCPSSSS